MIASLMAIKFGEQRMNNFQSRCIFAAVVLLLTLNWHFLFPEQPLSTAQFSPTYISPNKAGTEHRVLLDAGRLRVRINSRSGDLEIKTSSGTLVATSAARPYLRSGGEMHQLAVGTTSNAAGCDTLGCFTSATFEWRSTLEDSTSLAASMTTAVRAYAALDIIVFSQQFPSSLQGTSSLRPCGFIGGPAASLFNDCGLASAFPRLSPGDAYRQWLSWSGGGNSPEPAFGSFDAMPSQAAFIKQAEQGGGSGSRVARGLLTIAYEGHARKARTVQQELDAIILDPPWGRGGAANYSRAKAFCLGERRCRGFSWQVPLPGAKDAAIEPAPGVLARWRFVTDNPTDNRGLVPLAFYASSAATNLGGLVAAPILLPSRRSLNDTIALTALSSFMSSSVEYDVATGSLDFGILGSVAGLPAGFSIEWLVAIDDGFNSALRKAGAAVLQRAGTAKAKRAHATAEVSLNSLGYATQQGAWYYYNTAPRPSEGVDATHPGGPDSSALTAVGRTPRMWGERYATSGAFGCAVNVSDPPARLCKSYSETIMDIKRRADEVSLPYQWWLMDSWWAA